MSCWKGCSCTRRRAMRSGRWSVLLGHLYDGIAFDATVTTEEGRCLLKVADRLTYRQLVALAALQDPENSNRLATASYQRDEGSTSPTDALALELDDLADQGVLGVRVEGAEEIARPGELYGSSGRASAKDFQNLQSTSTGLNLHRLMRLDTIHARGSGAFPGRACDPPARPLTDAHLGTSESGRQRPLRRDLCLNLPSGFGPNVGRPWSLRKSQRS